MQITTRNSVDEGFSLIQMQYGDIGRIISCDNNQVINWYVMLVRIANQEYYIFPTTGGYLAEHLVGNTKVKIAKSAELVLTF